MKGRPYLRIRQVEFSLHHFNIRCFKKIHRVFVCTVGGAVNDARDAGIDQHLGAVDTRQMSNVTHGAFGGDPMQRSLNDSVCLRVNCADTCLLYTSPSPRGRTRSRMPSSA